MSKSVPQQGREFLEFKNSVRGSRAPLKVIEQARAGIRPSMIATVTAWLETAAPQGRRIRSPAFPSVPKALHTERPLKALPLTDELLWAAERLRLHQSRLQTFAVYAAALYKLILRGDAGQALGLLDKLQYDLGYSLWLIKLRLALLHRAEGFDAQKRYLLQLLDSSLSPIASYITQWVSIRNESAVTPASFSAMYGRESLDPTGDHTLIVTYANFHIQPRIDISPDEAATVLAHAAAGSIIDLYDAFVRLSSLFWPYCSATVSSGHLARTIRSLSRTICDPVLDGVNAMYTRDWSSPLLPSADCRAIDYFLTGDYESAKTLSERNLLNNPADWESINLLARCLAATPSLHRCTSYDGYLWGGLAVLLSQFLLTPNADGAWEELQRFSMNLDALPIADSVRGFLIDEISDNLRSQVEHVSSSLMIPPVSLNPLRVRTLPQQLRDSYLKECYARTGRTVAFEFTEQLESQSAPVFADQIEPNIADLALAEIALKDGRLSDAVALSSAAHDRPRYFANRMIRIHVNALVSSDSFAACVDYVTRLYRANPESYLLLPIQRLARVLDKPKRSALRANISTPILFEIYSRHYGSSLDTLFRSSYQQFCAARDINKPSEILRVLSYFALDEVIYFLRYVCVPSIIRFTRSLRTAKDVQDERLAICQILATLDTANTIVYQEEIRDITTDQAVQAGHAHLERSRIYVDLEGVGRAAEKTTKESFIRYKPYQARIDLMRKIVERLAKAVPDINQLNLRVKGGDGVEIMYAMIESVRDEFISNTEYGLNGYLSVNIRHGILQGHLRSPLERHKLITQREATTSRYRPNAYWKNRLEALPDASQETVLSALASFSARFDALITTMRSEWIQVRRAEKEPGLFDFGISVEEANTIATEVTSETSFDDFLGIVVRHCSNKLEVAVAAVRQKILTTGKDEVSRLLEALRLDVFNATKRYDNGGLISAIVTAKTDMQHALNRMADWFQLPSEAVNLKLPVSLAVKVACETIQRFHPSFRLTPNFSIKSDLDLSRPRWTAAVTAMLNLFENVYKYCGYSEGCDVSIETWAEADGLFLSVTNPVAPTARSVGAEQLLNEIAQDLRTGRYLERVSREGGTGLCKTAKMLGSEGGALEKMDFRFQENRFEVRVWVRAE